ncbi:hypothetical protein Ahy_B09g098668 [Arachis hypogaea]|uniref:Uncharacterized protein n=1 Tax=Arachis hypogaea TaxID=3818 RepID=A0A444XRR4_ARAHY|nr:hypothetical protein Ahy_B09g098668 [Arachis hypogaea]
MKAGSQQNKMSRAANSIIHTTGAKGVQQRAEEAFEQTGQEIDRLRLWELTHTRANGQACNEETQEKLYDPAALDFESGLHPIHGDKKIRQMQKNKMVNEDTNEFYIYFDHPIMKDFEVPFEEDDLEHEADVESSDKDDVYESAEDKLYKPPPPGCFLDKSDEECMIINKVSKKEKKKSDLIKDDNKRKRVEREKISPNKKHVKGATKNSVGLGRIKSKSNGSKATPTANGPTTNGIATTIGEQQHSDEEHDNFTIAEGRRNFYIKNDERRVRVACVYGEHMMGKKVEKEKAKARLKAKKKTGRGEIYYEFR